MSELMDQIAIGEHLITPDGYEAVIDGKYPLLNLLSVTRVDDDTITGLFAPEECLLIAEVGEKMTIEEIRDFLADPEAVHEFLHPKEETE